MNSSCAGLLGSASGSCSLASGFGGVILGVYLYLLAMLLSVLVYVFGLVRLLRGEVCGPVDLVDALADLRPKHWVLLVALTILGARLFFLIRPCSW